MLFRSKLYSGDFRVLYDFDEGSKNENSIDGMLYFPSYRGIAKYSIVRVPFSPLSLTFKSLFIVGSYVSKLVGNFTSGFCISLLFPVPEISNFTVIASLALVCSVLIELLSENEPTAFEKFNGLPSGSAFTSIVRGLVLSVFLTSAITSWLPKNVDTFLPDGTVKTVSNFPEGIVILPDLCGNNKVF